MTGKRGVFGDLREWLRANERSHLARLPLWQSWIETARRECDERERDARLKQRRRRSWQQITRPPIIKEALNK